MALGLFIACDEGMVADIRWDTDAVCSPSDVDCRQSVECGDLSTVCVQLCDSNINRWCVHVASAFYNKVVNKVAIRHRLY